MVLFSSLLSGLLSVSEQTTRMVAYISIAAAAVLFGMIFLICFAKRKHPENNGQDLNIATKQGAKQGAKRLALAGMTLGLSFALSYLKFSPVTSGGSITLASMAPLLIYAYFYGVAEGLLVGLIFGLLNFISGPWILTPMTFILDYLLAYGSIGLMGFSGKLQRKKQNQTLVVAIGVLIVYIARFTCHLCSGFIYFAESSIWVEFPDWALANPFIYSFIYQCLYLPFDCLITLLVLGILAKTGALQRLKKGVLS